MIKQIGNAVPPTVWAKFVKQIIHCLDDWYGGRIDSLGNPVSQVISSSQRGLECSAPSATYGLGLDAPLLVSGVHDVNASTSSGFPAPRVKRAASSIAAINQLSAKTREMSLEETLRPARKEVVLIEDSSDDDIVIVETPRKRQRKSEGTLVDLTQ
jgi:hypothetical protein